MQSSFQLSSSARTTSKDALVFPFRNGPHVCIFLSSPEPGGHRNNTSVPFPHCGKKCVCVGGMGEGAGCVCWLPLLLESAFPALGRKRLSVVWLVLLQPLIWVWLTGAGSGEQLFKDSGLRDCGAPSWEDAAISGQWASQWKAVVFPGQLSAVTKSCGSSCSVPSCPGEETWAVWGGQGCRGRGLEAGRWFPHCPR